MPLGSWDVRLIFLDLPEKEQQNWKHLYNKMCQFLDAINVTLTNQT